MSTTDAKDEIIIIDELNNLHNTAPKVDIDVCANCEKEGRSPCGKEEVTDKNITCCTDDIKKLQITCTEEVDVCACCGKGGR